MTDPEDARLITTILTSGHWFRIIQDLNIPLSESCKICIASLLDDFEGAPVYKKDKPLSLSAQAVYPAPSSAQYEALV
jgi:hypothetical protein